MGKEHTVVARFRADPIEATELERTMDRVWLSATCCCERSGLLGVPMARMDILVDGRVETGTVPPHHIVVLEISRKTGHITGDTRDRWVWRSLDPHCSAARAVDTWGMVEVDRQAGATDIRIRGGDGSVLFERTYPSYTWELDREADTGRILWWQYNKYFKFLPADDVTTLAGTFLLSKSVRTVSEANREAARQLYRLARELGWRRLTLRERIRMWGPEGRDRPIWHRESEIADLLYQTGAGEATHRAADGGTLEPVQEW